MARCMGRVKVLSVSLAFALMLSLALALSPLSAALACFNAKPAYAAAPTEASYSVTAATETTLSIAPPALKMPTSSMYCWTPPYAFSSEQAGGSVLKALNVNRLYQSFGSKTDSLMKMEDTAKRVADLKRRGIDTYMLCGEPAWGLVDSEVQKGIKRVDYVRQYNDGIGASAPIAGIVFDIESFTTSMWKANVSGSFRTYVDNMKTIYNHAKANKVKVIQCIPYWLDDRDKSLLEELIKDCCDEVSVMNYNVGKEVDSIANEVALCQKHNKPIESIFNTMPINDTTITESTSYINRSFADIMANRAKLEQAYGASNVGMSYHHYENIVPLLTGGRCIANVYAYTSKADPVRDSRGQTSSLGSLILKGSDGVSVKAYPYYPALPTKATPQDMAYLAIGIKPGVTYKVQSGDPMKYRVTTPTPTFTKEEKGLLYRASIGVEPGVDDSAKVANGLVAKAKAKVLTVKAAKLKKKAYSFSKAKAFKVTGANGKVTFAKVSGNKKIVVSKAGKVELKKGLKKGSYTVKVKVTAVGDATHHAMTKTVSIKLKVT